MFEIISVVRVNLDSLRRLTWASRSVLILMSSTLFLSALNCQRLDRKVAVHHARGKSRSSAELKLSVRTSAWVILGTYLWRPCRRAVPVPWLLVHSNRAWLRVSTTWSSALQWVQCGEWLGRILATLSAVGRIWWRSLNKKLVRFGPHIFCFESCQLLSHWTDGVIISTLRGFRGGKPCSSVSTSITSSSRNLYICFSVRFTTLRGELLILLMAGKIHL